MKPQPKTKQGAYIAERVTSGVQHPRPQHGARPASVAVDMDTVSGIHGEHVAELAILRLLSWQVLTQLPLVIHQEPDVMLAVLQPGCTGHGLESGATPRKA